MANERSSFYTPFSPRSGSGALGAWLSAFLCFIFFINLAAAAAAAATAAAAISESNSPDINHAAADRLLPSHFITSS
jgi:hypothetical protein